MKLRYYLRGLGVGIIVTAIIMNIAFSNKQEMSDEEIKARAAELGMIEDTVLAPNQTPTPTAGAAADGQGWTNIVTPTQTDDIAVSHAAGQTTEQPAQGEAASGVPTPTAAITETPMSSPTAKPTATPTATPTPTQAVQETVTITINSGEGSGTVSRKAAQAGLVADAADFDRYLCANGYDKKLAVGNHIIPVGASYEEIAKKLTSHGN